ncbi:transposase [Enterococcus cecorum]|nr:transposase [Enterococcus cecorum]CAI3254811.1 transposase [Enterococcus cecorum]CAI3266125.1 transposase [Enterococcus cecorum]CAI3296625.1 transposase [Enterococcus cecorum]CAI3302358.1 transposase [Enterococcus cecorum]
MTVSGKPEEETITYRRKKAKGKWQAIFQQFKPEVIHHELTGDACTCPNCHEKLKEIQRQELVYVPAQLKRAEYIQHAYKCVACSKKNATDKIIKAPVPKAPWRIVWVQLLLLRTPFIRNSH